MIIHELSDFIINLNYEDIPNESIEKAKLCFIDYLAVYFRGLKTENSKIAIKTIYQLYGNNFNALNNAFINGIASHSLDLDDGHRVAQLHPGSIVFSTALSMISNDYDCLDISSREFFESVIVGYEVAIVLGSLANPIHRNQGFHSTGTIGSIASAAVASKLLKLNQKQTEHALGLATTQSAGLLEADHAGTMGKSLHVGNAAYSGILSAYLAKNGFTGGESLIDGKEGFLKAMASNLKEFNNCDNDSFKNIQRFLDDNLGQFRINEVYLKKYPFCRHIHSAIDSSLKLKESINDSEMFRKSNDCDLSFNDLIDSIEIKTYKIASEHDNYSPKNPQDLKQSLPYAVAISLESNDLSLDNIDNLIENGLLREDSNNDIVSRIKELSSKVNICCNEGLDKLTPQKRPSNVLIRFKDDNLEPIEDTTFYPLGENENPLGIDDILDKFKLLNPKFNMNKLQIIKHMENYSIHEVLDELGFVFTY